MVINAGHPLTVAAALWRFCDVWMCVQFRFIVDGVWKWADDQPAVRDDDGNYINIVEVPEFVPENLESLSGFEPPPSPPSR